MSRIRADQWRSVRWVLPYVRPYRFRLLLSALLLMIGTLLSLAFPWLMGRMLDSALNPGKSAWNMQHLALALGALLAVQAVLSFVRIRTMIEVAEKVLADARSAVFDHLLRMPMSFYMKHRVGELQSRLSSDLSQIQDAVSSTLTEWLRQVLVLVGGLALLVYTSWNLTLFLLMILPLLVLVAVVFGRKIRRLAGRAQDELANSQVVVEETLQSIAMVKAYTGEVLQGARYRTGLEATVREVMKAAWYRGAFAAFIVFGLFGTVVLVLWYGAGMVQEGQMSVGELTGFVLYATFVGGAMGSFAELYGQLQKSLGATERVSDLLKEPTEDEVWAEKGASLASIPNLRGSDGEESDALVLEEVSFAYPSRPEVLVLDRVSLRIRQGERLAVVGPSGAGKSTLVHLLLGFYAPDSGGILVNGRDLRTMDLRTYRESLAVVPQDLSLFGGTLADNIAYGRPAASESQSREAAEQAHALDFIMAFPQGMQTMVGERGIQISGGQRQRVAIARAILRDPKFLFLDEATSALDTESEVAVQRGLDRLMEGRTTVVVAHRLSTVRHADRVAFLDGGRVVEYGTPAELMSQKDSRFRQWMESQGETA
jgi:ATP-binding cassette subfamily B protein